MKIIAIIILCAAMFGCGNSDETITNAVKTAVLEALDHTPKEFQTPLANYIDVGAKGVYSIDGTPTVKELITKVIAFIPKDVQEKYPLITTTITTAVSLAYLTYGKSSLAAIGKGLEAGAAPYIGHNVAVFGRTMRPCPPHCVTWDGHLVVTRRAGN